MKLLCCSLVLSLALLVASAPLSPTIAPIPVPVYRMLTSSGGGSCFVVETFMSGDQCVNVVLTAGHVVDDETILLVEGQSGFGALLARHPTEDLALVMFVGGSPLEPARLKSNEPAIGELLFLSGFPMLEGPWIRIGMYSGDSHVSCNAYPGDSGGPVYDINGCVAGVMSYVQLDGWTIVGFAATYAPIDAEWIERELSSVR